MQTKFSDLSVLVEASSGTTPTLESIKRFIDIIAAFGYNTLYLGCADAHKIDNEPYYNYKRGGYTKAQFREMDAYAASKGIEIVAQIQTISHIHFMYRHDVYKDLYDTPTIFMEGEPKVYEFLDKQFKTFAEGLSSRRIHIGFDEAFGIGTGNYLKKHGCVDKKEILLKHLKKVVKIAQKYGYTCEMWGDMLFEKENTTVTPAMVKASIPDDTTVFLWEYNENDREKLATMIDNLKNHANKVAFAGSAMKFGGYAPNNVFSMARILPQMQICNEKGLRQYMITLWGDNCSPCSIFETLPTLFLAAEYSSGSYKIGGEINKKKFQDIVGVSYDDMLALDYLNDPFKRHGYKKMGDLSFWAFYMDILLSNYDMLLPDGTGAAFACLANEYAHMRGGKLSYIYNKAQKMAEILAIKTEIAKKLRLAYAQKDAVTLKKIVEDLDALIGKVKEFSVVYEEFFLAENMAFGLECNQLYIGGQILRYEYVIRRIEKYLKTGEPIEELETETIPPSIIPYPEYDECMWFDYRNLISYSII